VRSVAVRAACSKGSSVPVARQRMRAPFRALGQYPGPRGEDVGGGALEVVVATAFLAGRDRDRGDRAAAPDKDRPACASSWAHEAGLTRRGAL
jgi:hypothetical protein